MAKCASCGRKGLFLKLNHEGLCEDCAKDQKAALNNEIERLKNLLTPELQDVHEALHRLDQVRNEIADASAELIRRESSIRDLDDEIADRDAKIAAQRSQIIVNDELLELEEFALYQPRFKFASAEEYKRELTLTRDRQKGMIKNDLAAIGNSGWTVNGNAAKGRKMVNDMKKLCLRAFNNECDTAVNAVRFNNYDKCEQRIRKSADQIAKLGTIMGVEITDQYIWLKIQELQLALEYAQKKQEEKEHQRELRAQQREEARLAKEIEEQRKAAYKEQSHYTNALKKLQVQLAQCADTAQRNELLQKQTELEEHLGSLEAHLADLDYREANQRAGYVYVISNIGSFGEGVYKIGMTRRLDPSDRIDELSGASVPFNFDVHAMIFSDDAPALEAALHRAFEDRKVNAINQRREFFKVPIDEIEAVVRANHDKSVEFTKYPPAEQFRETLKLRSAKN